MDAVKNATKGEQSYNTGAIFSNSIVYDGIAKMQPLNPVNGQQGANDNLDAVTARHGPIRYLSKIMALSFNPKESTLARPEYERPATSGPSAEDRPDDRSELKYAKKISDFVSFFTSKVKEGYAGISNLVQKAKEEYLPYQHSYGKARYDAKPTKKKKSGSQLYLIAAAINSARQNESYADRFEGIEAKAANANNRGTTAYITDKKIAYTGKTPANANDDRIVQNGDGTLDDIVANLI